MTKMDEHLIFNYSFKRAMVHIQNACYRYISAVLNTITFGNMDIRRRGTFQHLVLLVIGLIVVFIVFSKDIVPSTDPIFLEITSNRSQYYAPKDNSTATLRNIQIPQIKLKSSFGTNETHTKLPRSTCEPGYFDMDKLGNISQSASDTWRVVSEGQAYIYSAYFDPRYVDETRVNAIGLLSSEWSRQQTRIYCQLWKSPLINATAIYTKADIITILPHRIERYGQFKNYGTTYSQTSLIQHSLIQKPCFLMVHKSQSPVNLILPLLLDSKIRNAT